MSGNSTTPDDKNQKVYRSSTIGPRVLPGHSLLPLLIFEVYFKHFCKILAQTMRSCTLDTTSSVGNKCLVETHKFETIRSRLKHASNYEMQIP